MIAIGSATADRLFVPLEGRQPARPQRHSPRHPVAPANRPYRSRVESKKGRGFWRPTVWRIAGAVWRETLFGASPIPTWPAPGRKGRAVYNKGAKGVVDQTQHVEENLPFALLGMDFDNGTEWLNWHLIKYLQNRAKPVQVTRSRPYCSNDNAHVEQKNYMWPRQLLGYGRLEEPSVVPLINSLLCGGLGAVAQLFPPLHEAGQKMARGLQMETAARRTPRQPTKDWP